MMDKKLFRRESEAPFFNEERGILMKVLETATGINKFDRLSPYPRGRLKERRKKGKENNFLRLRCPVPAREGKEKEKRRGIKNRERKH